MTTEAAVLPKMNYTFSGHDTFHCRGFWLKKGFDMVKGHGAEFNDSAVLKLGVGRNMVSSIRYWMKSFQLLSEEGKLSDFAQRLLKDDGWDPYLEDEGSLWILHFLLVNSLSRASSYHLLFGELRGKRQEFTKNHYKSLALEKDPNANINTLDKDFSVFLRMYMTKSSKNKEDAFSGILSELFLVKDQNRKDNKGNGFYRIENSNQDRIPAAVILYLILTEFNGEKSISLNSLYEHSYSIGNALVMSRESMESKLTEIAESDKRIVYKNDAGVKEVQLKGKAIDPNKILSEYYG